MRISVVEILGVIFVLTLLLVFILTLACVVPRFGQALCILVYALMSRCWVISSVSKPNINCNYDYLNLVLISNLVPLTHPALTLSNTNYLVSASQTVALGNSLTHCWICYQTPATTEQGTHLPWLLATPLDNETLTSTVKAFGAQHPLPIAPFQVSPLPVEGGQNSCFYTWHLLMWNNFIPQLSTPRVSWTCMSETAAMSSSLQVFNPSSTCTRDIANNHISFEKAVSNLREKQKKDTL